MSAGEYGDSRLDLLEVNLQDYDNWLYKIANNLLPYARRSERDDVVQEGRIAAWKALRTYDASKGSIPSWVTKHALWRMTDMAGGRPYTGHVPARGVGHRANLISLDALVDSGSFSLETLLASVELLDSVSLAYHQGEILKAISELSESQRKYIMLRFWGGLTCPEMVKDGYFDSDPGYLWRGQGDKYKGAKKVLKEKLEHLGV